MAGDPYYTRIPAIFNLIPSYDGSPLPYDEPSKEMEESEPMEESKPLEETESVASSIQPVDTLYCQLLGSAKMKHMAHKSIPKCIMIKKNQKGTSSDTHRVQDKPVRIAQKDDR